MGEVGEEKLLLKLLLGHTHRLLSEGEKRDGGHTHRWTIYLRSPTSTPLDSALLTRVVFQLHPDFKDAKRVVKQPPFEVTETGYAGFNVPVHLTFAHCKKEYYLEYDMNLTYAQADKHEVERVLEFRNPKSSLRHQLLRAGAISQSAMRKVKKEERSGFEALFGETLKPHQKEKKGEKTEKAERAEKAERTEKTEKAEKTEKGEKGEGSKGKVGKKAPPPAPSPVPSEKSVEGEMNPQLLKDLVKAVGGDEKLVPDLAKRPAPSSSPIFRTESSDSDGPAPTPTPPKPKKKKKPPEFPAVRESGSELTPERIELLRGLQRKIMTLEERSVAQKVADIVTATPGYSVSQHFLEFDLCALNSEAIAQLASTLP